MTDRGQALLTETAEEFASLRREPNIADVDIATIRRLRAKARSAMDWLEDTEAFEEAHSVLDQLGQFVRTTRVDACELLFEDGAYYQTCPVALAHDRMGMSPTFIIRESECSVCGVDPWDCEHILGDEYGGQVAHLVITRADLVEVSFVSRPRQPDARIMKVSISSSDLAEELGPDFASGMPVICGRCLSDCVGVSDTFDQDAAKLREAKTDGL